MRYNTVNGSLEESPYCGHYEALESGKARILLRELMNLKWRVFNDRLRIVKDAKRRLDSEIRGMLEPVRCIRSCDKGLTG